MIENDRTTSHVHCIQRTKENKVIDLRGQTNNGAGLFSSNDVNIQMKSNCYFFILFACVIQESWFAESKY